MKAPKRKTGGKKRKRVVPAIVECPLCKRRRLEWCPGLRGWGHFLCKGCGYVLEVRNWLPYWGTDAETEEDLARRVWVMDRFHAAQVDATSYLSERVSTYLPRGARRGGLSLPPLGSKEEEVP